MATELSREVEELFANPESTKVLATVDEHGFPHVVVKQSLHVDEEGNLVFLEMLESSRTNRNLVRSIWFDGKVAVTVSEKGGQSWQIKGKPVKAHITGAVFLRHYEAIRGKLGDVDLAAVWVIEPEEVINEAFASRRSEEERLHPTVTHLDRLAGA